MKKLKKVILCLFSICCLFTTFNVTEIKAYSISYSNFKPKDSSEWIVKHTNIGYWNNGGFFETVTRQQIGTDPNTGYSTWRFRYYITHRGDNGSYVYQKIPVGLVIDGVKKATFDQTKSGNVRNTTKLWGEYTMSLSPGQHKVQLADIKGGAITVVNATAMITVRIPQYTVTFVDYNGTVLKKQTVELNKNATPPSNPSLTGYTFTGWNGNYKNVKRDETVTAQYNVNKFTVNFVDYDNRLIKSQLVEYGYNASPPPNPTRTGYTFNGWNGSYTNVTSNRTIVASYRINTYIVDFNSNGGSFVPSKVVTYGDKVGRPSDPVKTNNRFIGWYTDSSLSTSYNFNSAVTSDMTLYAKWLITHYDISFSHRTNDSVNGWQTIKNEFRKLTANSTLFMNNLSDNQIPIGYEPENRYDLYKNGTQVGSTYNFEKSQKVNGSFDTVVIRYKGTPAEIKAKETYYFQGDNVKSTDLVKRATAMDIKDGDISNKISVLSIEYPNKKVTKPYRLETDKLQDVTVTYTVTNSRGIVSYAEAKVHIVKRGADLDTDTNDAKIYTRFISDDVLVDGTTPLTTLRNDSVWRKAGYADILHVSLTNDSPLTEYDYVNQAGVESYMKSVNPGKQVNEDFVTRFK